MGAVATQAQAVAAVLAPQETPPTAPADGRDTIGVNVPSDARSAILICAPAGQAIDRPEGEIATPALPVAPEPAVVGSSQAAADACAAHASTKRMAARDDRIRTGLLEE